MRVSRPVNRIALLLVVLFLGSVTALATNWPTFRNTPSNAGATAETINLPLVERWHSTAPDVEENGVVVADGVAYMLSENGQLHAFTVATGFEVAGYPVSTAATYGTPAVDAASGKVYVLAGASLRAFDLNGIPAWTRSVGTTGTNYSQGPLVEGGFVYFSAGGNVQKYSSVGVLQWSSPGVGYNVQPAIMGGYVYANNESGLIRKYDKSTGVQVTTGGFPIATTGQSASLTATDGKIFFKSDQLYVYSDATGALLWSRPIGGNATYYNSPAVANGAVYVYGWDGKLYGFDEGTGATLTGFPSVALSTANDRNWSSPVVAGDKVFVAAGTSQKLKVLGAAGSASPGVVLAEYLTFSSDPQGFDLCSPAVSDGYVFAMLDGGGLYAFFGGGGVPPVGALVINGGDGCTASRNVTLTLDNNDNPNVTQMRISEDPFFTGVPWVSYQGTTLFTLSAGYGLKTVYAQLRDNAGQVSVVFTDQIAYQAVCGEPNVVATASSLSVESCTPANGVADPGERVTYALTLSNIGTAPTTNLVATLIAGANVSAPSAPQSYGVIPPGGNATRTFSWTGVGTSGQPWTAIVRLADGTLTFPNATITGTYGSSLGCATVRLVTRTVLSRVGANVQAVITVTNTGSTTANSVALTRALLGATAGAPLPQSLGNIPAGGSASATVAFPNVVAGTSTLSIGGTYTGGTFTSKVRVRVP